MKKQTILIILLVLVIIIFCMIYIRNISSKSNGKLYDIEGNALEEIKFYDMSHIIIKGTITNSNIKYIEIFTLDENDIVINAREIDEYGTEEEAQKKYNELIASNIFRKVSINGNTIVYNNISITGITKNKILEICNSADEILEY